jgi:hypothetical protein
MMLILPCEQREPAEVLKQTERAGVRQARWSGALV